VQRLHGQLTRTRVQLRVHRPLQPVGHFGAFARRGQALWPEFEATLRELAGDAVPGPVESAEPPAAAEPQEHHS
jgi:hypothetical protein